MNTPLSCESMSTLSETMLITLWAKAVEYDRPDALIRDAIAVDMLKQIDYDFSIFAKSKMSQPGCCGRAALFDGEIKRFLVEHPDAVVVQLGAGLDARFERLDKPAVTAWYDLDLPDVIEVRRRLLPESGNVYLSGSMFDEEWAKTVAAHGKPVLLVIEGVLMYFKLAEVQAFFAMISRLLPEVSVIFDMVPAIAVGHAKHHDALGKMSKNRPEFEWSLKEPKEMEQWQPGLRVSCVLFLSDYCVHRYPWLFQMIYRTKWGRRIFDQRIIRVDLA